MKTRIPLLASVIVAWLLSLADANAFYDPGLQRWINRDPIEEDGGLNLNSFVFNASINSVDHFGLAIVFVPSDWQGAPPLGDTIVPCPGRPSGVSLQANMAKAESIAKQPTQQYPMSSFGNTAGKYIWFHDQVKTGGPWDYKNQPTRGAHPEYEDFGNFHYGATGSALGLDPLTLQNEAGIAQQNDPVTKGAGRGKPGSRLNPGNGIPPFGDEPKDNEWIKMGIEYNKQYPAWKGKGPCG